MPRLNFPSPAAMTALPTSPRSAPQVRLPEPSPQPTVAPPGDFIGRRSNTSVVPRTTTVAPRKIVIPHAEVLQALADRYSAVVTHSPHGLLLTDLALRQLSLRGQMIVPGQLARRIGPDDRTIVDLRGETDGDIAAASRLSLGLVAACRSICSLQILMKDGTYHYGTGWFATPRLVMTAGHCVYDRGSMQWASQITVMPDLQGDVMPYGAMTSGNLVTTERWKNDGADDCDYGAIVLPDESLGNAVGSLELQALDDAALTGETVTIAGYPWDLGRSRQMYQHTDVIESVGARTLYYEVDTTAGDSGAPVMVERDGKVVVVGVHSGGDLRTNVGVRVVPDLLDEVKEWMGRR
jgi:glutamyl endopeptidase